MACAATSTTWRRSAATPMSRGSASGSSSRPSSSQSRPLTRPRYDGGSGRSDRLRRGSGPGPRIRPGSGATRLARRGRGYRRERAGGVAAEIGDLGGTAVPFACDVTDSDQAGALARDAARDLGPIAGLVNNAAIFSALEMGPFDEIEPAVWERVMEVNVTGVFQMCRAVVPRMRAGGYGKIVNISSATIFTGRPMYLHYVTTKAALIGLTRALAAEVGPSGIRVNAVTPGSTETEIERATITPAQRQAMAAATALRRVQVPADLVGAVGFLYRGTATSLQARR